jgi:hypothetical protein
VDWPPEEAAVAGELKVYDVEIHGTKTQMKLTAEHAKRMGGTSVTSAPQLAAQDADDPTEGEKSTRTQDAEEADAVGSQEPEEASEAGQKAAPARSKARTARNKARTASNKDG